MAAERYMVSTLTAKSNDNPQKGNARGLPGPELQGVPNNVERTRHTGRG